ncbi:MAG: PD-(D/E)XK nuclease family protein [Solirubrobacteraceae bacterium]
MTLTLVLGPANSAKAGELLGAYANAAHRDALLVVPTPADAEHYDRELAGDGALLGRSLTFNGLIAEIARRAGYAATPLSSLQRERVLRRVIASLALDALGDSARTAGFPAAAGRLIAELARRRLAPQRFAAALRRWAGDDRSRSAYAQEVGRLYLAYARELERLGRPDAELYAWRALDALRAQPGRWRDTPVFFYGFDDLTPLQHDAIETLSRIAGVQITASLTYEPGRSALSARASVAEDLRAIAASVRLLPARQEHYDAGARTALHHVERFLFEPDAPRIDPGPAVALLEAGGERAEAELIAAEVLCSLRAGVAAGEIVVVCRALARSGALLERVLRRHGIAVHCDRMIALPQTALGRSLLALARCALLDAEQASAEDLLGYLRAPGLLERLEPIDALQEQVRRRGLLSAHGARAASGLSLGEIDALRQAPDLSAELARQTRRLLAAPHRARAALLDGEQQLDARAAAAVLSALTELAQIDERLSAVELLDTLAGLQLRAGVAGYEDAVLIAEPLAIRARRFRVVFVCGLCEGEFPEPGSGDPFLSDERRRELALAGGLVLGAAEDALARERYLMYASCSRASERLVLSYRSSDEEGNLVLPSPFIADLAELFVEDWVARRRRRLLADVVWSAEEAPTARELELTRAAAAPDGSAAARATGTRTLGERALRHVRHREVVSGGALETFAACPVKWLVERQLAPGELASESEALVRGSFMHSVLEGVIARLAGPLTPASLGLAEGILDELVADPPETLAPGRPDAVRVAILRGIEADLRRYLRHEAAGGCDWVPHALELRFGFDESTGSLPAVVLGAGDRRVLLRGMIDRIDLDPAGARAIVRDYKSGANRPERAAARWRSEHQLQVALYMIAVRQLLALEPVAGFYQPLTGRELRARGAYVAGAAVGEAVYGTDALDREALQELLRELEEQAVEIAVTLARGELTPCPATCSRDGCRHPGICWAG